MNPYESSNEPGTRSPGKLRVTVVYFLVAVTVSFAAGYVAGEVIGSESYRRYAREMEEKNAVNTKMLLDEISRLNKLP